MACFFSIAGCGYQVGGVPEHDQIPQPVDQTQCSHNVRSIIPQQPCWTQGTDDFNKWAWTCFAPQGNRPSRPSFRKVVVFGPRPRVRWGMSVSLRRPRVQRVPAVIEALSDIDARRRAAAFISCEQPVAFICECALLQLVPSDNRGFKGKKITFFSLFCRHFTRSICSLKNTTSRWRRTRRRKSKTSTKCWRYARAWLRVWRVSILLHFFFHHSPPVTCKTTSGRCGSSLDASSYPRVITPTTSRRNGAN